MDTKRYSATAYYKEKAIACTDQAIYLEGNYYFPLSDVPSALLEASEKIYTCPWKGKADYRNIRIEGELLKDAAWTYIQPSEAAADIKEMIAFDAASGIQIKNQ